MIKRVNAIMTFFSGLTCLVNAFFVEGENRALWFVASYAMLMISDMLTEKEKDDNNKF